MKNVRKLFTLLNLHIAGVVILLGIVLFVGTKAFIALHESGETQSEAFQQEQLHYVQLKAQMGHLEGLPAKVKQSSDDAQKFYDKRIAPNYSTLLVEFYAPAIKNQVHISRTGYTQTAAIEGLREVRIDASLSGEYTALVHFINDLERDQNHVFFTITGVALSGQQGGLVNLRLRASAYLLANANDQPPQSSDEGEAANDAGGEGGNQ
ncbi:hypothetical protein [Silvibacterium dinghuense]|uniref:Uncharacterized protein n=1 Tax=Silvibacterium dinghuense TaxID=1560006 RepID=A0A4V1NV37_9BACT|nr:hypothetical protein [Silvibacterium dinghuense]RXS94402.1 hypothetical protein ESZ00_15100 [Silvibacterium dinghuense]GGH16351.1 hypothetical protein GCM10011586_38110 [Silvibacterium dinghuense]